MGSSTSATRRAPVAEDAHTVTVVPEMAQATTTHRPPLQLVDDESTDRPRPPWYACCPRFDGPRIVLLPMTPAKPAERILQLRGGTVPAAPFNRPRAASFSLAAADRDENGGHSFHPTARQNSISAQSMSLSQLITPANPKQRGGARTRIVKARTPSGDFTLGAHKAVHLLSSLFAAALSESELAFLSSLAELHHYDRGQSIVRQGTHPSSELFVLCSGEVCVEVEGADGISEDAFEGTGAIANPTTFHSAAPPNAVKPASNRSRAASRTGSFAADKAFAPCDPAHPMVSTRDSAAAMLSLGSAASSRRQSLTSPNAAPIAAPTSEALSLPVSTPIPATQSTKLFATPASLLSERRRTLSVTVGASHAVAAPTTSPPPLPSPPSAKRASDSSLLREKDKAVISPTGAFVLRGQRQAPSPKSALDTSPAPSPLTTAAPVYRRLALQSSGFVFGLEAVWKLPPPVSTATQAAAAASAAPLQTLAVATPRPVHLLPHSHTSSRKALSQDVSSADTSAETTPRATPRGSLLIDASAPSLLAQQQQQQPQLESSVMDSAVASSPSQLALPSFPRVCNVVALTDCTCLRVSQSALLHFLARFPQSFDPLLSVLGQHMERSMDSVSFLRVLSHPKRRLFGSLFAAKVVERNSVLFEEGQKCDDESCMYFLHAGTVRIVLPAAGNRGVAPAPSRPLTPTTTSPSSASAAAAASTPQWLEKDLVAGTFFGELSLLLDVDRTATAISSTSCVLLTINRASLRSFMELAPEMLHEFRRNLGGYVQNSYLLLLPHFQASFEEFCEREYSTENLAFWKECGRFKSLAEAVCAVNARERAASAEGSAVLPDFLVVMARAIYAEFVADDAPRQVNLRAAHRSVIRLALENGAARITSDLFVAASREIFALMSSDSFPRFRESELFAAALTKLNQPSTLLSSLVLEPVEATKEPSSSPTTMQPESAEGTSGAPQNDRASSDGHRRRSPFAALRALSSRLAPSSTAARALTPSGASTPPLSPHSPQSRLRSAGALGMLSSGVGEPSTPIAATARRFYAHDDQSMDIKDLPLAALHASDLPQAYLQMVQQRQQALQLQQPLPRSSQQPVMPQNAQRSSPRSMPCSRRGSLGDLSVSSAPPLCSSLQSSSFRPPPLHPPTPPAAGLSPRSFHAAVSIPLPLSPSTPIARSPLRTARSTVLASELERESDKQTQAKPHPTILTSPSALSSRSNAVAPSALSSPNHAASLFLPSAGVDGASASAPTTPRLPSGVVDARSPPLMRRQLIAVMRAN